MIDYIEDCNSNFYDGRAGKRKLSTEERRKYDRKYYETHKDKILTLRKRTVMCECGQVIREISLAKHKNTDKHLLKILNKK